MIRDPSNRYQTQLLHKGIEFLNFVQDAVDEMRTRVDDSRSLEQGEEDSTLKTPVRPNKNELAEFKEKLDYENKTSRFQNEFILDMQKHRHTLRVREDIEEVVNNEENLAEFSFQQLFIKMAKKQGTIFVEGTEERINDSDIDKAVKTYTKAFPVQARLDEVCRKEDVYSKWRQIL
ncbi:uncharacterized protein LOC111718002 isoform X2 [Eurytemora carolleeae]|uniref:uncharacterized protein LOC111718002 isoform X2 n=1 Tax=Eurytemora carolleeae TaxID=1294199 RepID=UPI000C7628B6|nr:uncharacterized protein LOC111718002 isoform X2 [Eurytemora carolleeae]|eukprot:XP_023349237.1 uncharacterized protein LOC111718002 isoform X2 [Eurytemora affinis]